MVWRLSAGRVEALCGKKQATGDRDRRFQRAGTDTGTAVTTASEHEFELHYVEDTAADHDKPSYFRPVEGVLSFDGQNRYQQDIAARSVDLATSLSYCDDADQTLDRFATRPISWSDFQETRAQRTGPVLETLEDVSDKNKLYE